MGVEPRRTRAAARRLARRFRSRNSPQSTPAPLGPWEGGTANRIDFMVHPPVFAVTWAKRGDRTPLWALRTAQVGAKRDRRHGPARNLGFPGGRAAGPTVRSCGVPQRRERGPSKEAIVYGFWRKRREKRGKRGLNIRERRPRLRLAAHGFLVPIAIVQEVELVFSREAHEPVALFGWQVFPIEILINGRFVAGVRLAGLRRPVGDDIVQALGPGRASTCRSAHTFNAGVFLIALLIVPDEQPSRLANRC